MYFGYTIILSWSHKIWDTKDFLSGIFSFSAINAKMSNVPK
jgi:hypothetical protein